MALTPDKSHKQLRQYLVAPINPHHADLPLLACCFVTGIIDAGAYNAWGTFMGMQTGKLLSIADAHIRYTRETNTPQ